MGELPNSILHTRSATRRPICENRQELWQESYSAQ